MKRSTCLGLGTALLFLLVRAFAATQPGSPAPGATNAAAAPTPAEDPAAVPRPRLQQDVDQARQRRVEKLMRQLQTSSAAQIQTILDNQRRLEALAGTALGLLALTALLSSAGLVLALQQRRALLSLAREKKDRGTESPAAPASEAGSGPEEGVASDLPSTPGSGEAATGGGPAPPAQDAGQIATVSASEDGEAPPPLPPGMRHRKVALLLARLCREAPRLAERFASSELRERFLRELDAPVHARLDRLIALSGQDDGLLQERWLGPDLVTTLDALARFYSDAVAEERNGHDTGLARDLGRWLYDAFGDVCRDEGWFAIDPIEPYKTKFNPQVHCAVAGRDVDGAEGQIIAIKSVGRRDTRTGAVKHQAEVIVGR